MPILISTVPLFIPCGAGYFQSILGGNYTSKSNFGDNNPKETSLGWGLSISRITPLAVKVGGEHPADL